MDSQHDTPDFYDLLRNPNFDRWLDGSVCGDYLGGEVDAGKFDECDFKALQSAVGRTDTYTMARFVVTCLERLYELSIEDRNAEIEVD